MALITVTTYRSEAGVHSNPAISVPINTHCDGEKKAFKEVFIHWSGVAWVEDAVYNPLATLARVALRVDNLCDATFALISMGFNDFRLRQLCCGQFPGGIDTPLVNNNGNEDLAFPLGVFNVDGVYLGIANNTAEYITLWNANAANQAVGQIVAGAGTVFTVVPIDPLDVIVLYGREFVTVQSPQTNLILHLDDGNTVVHGTTVYQATTVGVLTNTSADAMYNGSSHSLNLQAADDFNFRKVTTTSPANTNVYIFHDRIQRYIGFDVSKSISVFSGLLPTGLLMWSARTVVTGNYNTPITNWEACTSLKILQFFAKGGGVNGIDNPAFIPYTRWNKATIKYLSICDWTSLTSAELVVAATLTAANYPICDFLVFESNLYDITASLNTINFYLNIPKVNDTLWTAGTAAGAVDADKAWNDLGTALAGLVPVGVKQLHIKNTTAVTAASLAARNALAALTYTVTTT